MLTTPTDLFGWYLRISLRYYPTKKAQKLDVLHLFPLILKNDTKVH